MKNRTILITGANIGLGKEAARQLSSNGNIEKIFLAWRNLDKAKNHIPGQSRFPET